MALTLDGSTSLPMMGGTGMGSGAGLAAGGGGLIGGLIGGAVAGAFNRNGNNGWNGGYGGGYGAAPIGGAVATDLLLNPAFTSIQGQISALGDRMSDNAISAQLTAVNQNIDGTSRDTLNSVSDLKEAQASANFTTLNSINGLGRDLTASATQALINNIQNFNQVQISQATATNQIIAQLSAQAAAAAACCCDLKGLIVSDGNLTRALINANTMQDLRDRNVELAGQVSNFRQNQFLIDKLGGGAIV